MGYGGIARTVTCCCRALGATVTGVARAPRTEGDVRVIAVEDIESELPTTDVLLDDPAVDTRAPTGP